MNPNDHSPASVLPLDVPQAERRGFLQAGALIAAAAMSQAHASGATGTAAAPTKSTSGKREAVPGNFEFLTGEWRISNRRRKTAGTEDWDVFPGEASVWSILAGVCSIEELRIPARNFSGMGLRLLDLEKKVWIDHWVNGKSGVVSLPGTEGHFINGEGIFRGEWVDTEKKKNMQVYSAWDRITPDSCRWHQSISSDGKTGKSSGPWTGCALPLYPKRERDDTLNEAML
jgi:hypothetical protein